MFQLVWIVLRKVDDLDDAKLKTISVDYYMTEQNVCF